MNKKVMILFASAVLTASLAGTGCSYIKGANVADFLPTANQSAAVTQVTTGETTEVSTEEMAAAYDVQQGKLATGMTKTGSSHSNPIPFELPAVKTGKKATKTSSKKAAKTSKKATKKNTSKTSKATKKTPVKYDVCVPLSYIPASPDFANKNPQGVWAIGDPATYNPTSKKHDTKKSDSKKDTKKTSSKKSTDSKKHSTKKASDHKKNTVKKSYKINQDVKKKIEKIKKAAQKKAAQKKAAEKARKNFFKKFIENAKKAAQKKAAAKKAAKKAMKKYVKSHKSSKKSIAHIHFA